MDPSWTPALWVSWTLLIAGLAILVYVLVRTLTGGITGPAQTPDAPQSPGRTAAGHILDERLARGEITLEQHQAMSRALRGE